MRIGEFERASGLKRSTVRVYERLGLIQPGESPRGNGYRAYGPRDVERARLVRMAQGLGFSLKEIRALMRAWDGGELTEAAKLATLRAKLAEVEAKMEALVDLRSYLHAKVAWMEAGSVGAPPGLKGQTG